MVVPFKFQHSSLRTWFARVAFPTAMLVTYVGWSDSGPPRVAVHPVQGEIKFKGQALPNALVVLHPKTKDPKRVLSARGQTGPDGKFQLTTYDSNDGAPAGEYVVTVEYYQLIDKGGSFEPGPNVLSPKLASQAATDIAVTIKDGPNTLQPIEVDR